VIVIVLVAALTGMGSPQPAMLAPERAAPSWSTPVRISERGKPTGLPFIVASDDGVVHAVWTQNYQVEPSRGSLGHEAGAIYYSARRNSMWSEPVDIFVAPDNGQTVMGDLRIDASGRLHILWLSRPGMVYGTAPAAEASSARAWRTSTIGEDAQVGDIAVGADGAVHLVYILQAKGIYHVRSDDGGRSWSAPHTVWAAPDETSSSGSVNVEVDAGGAVHAVWVVNSAYARWGGVSVNYARSLDGGRTWQELLVLPEGDNEPNLGFDSGGGLHLFWNNPVGTKAGRGHAWSTDGGSTWDRIERLLPGHSGLTLWPRMGTDSAGNLHLVTAADSPEVPSPRVFHSTWRDGRWADFDLVSGPWSFVEAPALAVSAGNQLHVVWYHTRTDDPDEYGIWYATGLADAPAVAPRPLPTAPAPRLVPGATPSAAVAASTAPTVPLAPPGASSERHLDYDTKTWLPYAAGTLPPVLIVGLYLALRVRRERQ
jgi:hypothetical protein